MNGQMAYMENNFDKRKNSSQTAAKNFNTKTQTFHEYCTTVRSRAVTTMVVSPKTNSHGGRFIPVLVD